jgi:hypothetical protein
MISSLRLYESLLLLALRDPKGGFAAAGTLPHGVASAILAELALAGRIRFEDTKWSVLVRVSDSRLTGEPLMDQWLEKIRASRKDHAVTTWVNRIRATPRLMHRIAERLWHAGRLRREERTLLLFFNTHVYTVGYPSEQKELIDHLRGLVREDRVLSPKESALVALASRCGVLSRHFTRTELGDRRKRIDQMVKSQPFVTAPGATSSTQVVTVTARLIVLMAAFLYASVPLAAQSPTMRERVIGTWRVVAIEDWTPAGELTKPFGDRPTGYLMYDQSGRMSVQLQATCPDSTQRNAMACNGYSAYFGRFTVDDAMGVIVHHVEGALQPMLDSEPRPFRLAGDSLIFGEPNRWRRVFLRVR